MQWRWPNFLLYFAFVRSLARWIGSTSAFVCTPRCVPHTSQTMWCAAERNRCPAYVLLFHFAFALRKMKSLPDGNLQPLTCILCVLYALCMVCVACYLCVHVPPSLPFIRWPGLGKCALCVHSLFANSIYGKIFFGCCCSTEMPFFLLISLLRAFIGVTFHSERVYSLVPYFCLFFFFFFLLFFFC